MQFWSAVASRSLLLPFFTKSPATVSEESPMFFDYTLGALVTFGILVYLIFALIRPERF